MRNATISGFCAASGTSSCTIEGMSGSAHSKADAPLAAEISHSTRAGTCSSSCGILFWIQLSLASISGAFLERNE